MAKVRRSSSAQRVSPIKPGLTGARNWATAQVRAASYSKRGFIRLAVSVFILFLVIFSSALWLGGFFPDVRYAGDQFTRARLMSMGFVVKRVDVMGEGRLNEAEVRRSLGITAGDYLFDLDMELAQARIESLSWVDHAVVRRLWPDRIVVQIVERQPYALWQNENVVKVVDVKGDVIEGAAVIDYADLPLVVGPDAAQHAAHMQSLLGQHPDLQGRTQALVHVNGNRWNLQMQDGALWVMLPPEGVEAALVRLSDLSVRQNIFDRALGRIDLRLPDRITFRPATETQA